MNNPYTKKLEKSESTHDIKHSCAVASCEFYMRRIYSVNALIGKEAWTAYTVFCEYLNLNKLPLFTYNEFLCAAFGRFHLVPKVYGMAEKIIFQRGAD